MILVPRHPESESSTTSPSNNDDSNDPVITTGIVFAITVGIGLILLCVGCFFYRRGKKSASTAGEDDNVQLQMDHQVGDDIQAPGAPTNKLWWQDRSWATELEGYEQPVEAPATPLMERRLSELDIFPPPLRTMTGATEDRPGRKDSQGSAVILVGENQGQKKYTTKRWPGGGWPSFSR